MGSNNRNQPCWCGSGKKFKKCHLNREEQPTLTRGDLENYVKESNNKKLCSVSNLFEDECSKKIINAHTVSKSSSLKEISENGHVMGAKPSLNSLIKSNGQITLEKVGIKRASTFSGFCSVHDKELFSLLEDKPIVLNDHQLFLLAYRGMCREYFHKEQNKSTARQMKEADRGQNLQIQQMIQNGSSLFDQGVDLALRDLKYIKSKMDHILLKKEFSKMNHCIFELSEVPKIQVSAMVIPEIDFQGNTLQKLGLKNENYDYILFNCISYEGKGCFVFSWLDEQSHYCNKFITSLLKLENNEIENALVRFCYSFSENTWASPSWWKLLGIQEKKSINNRLKQGTPMAFRPTNCLMDDGAKFNAFKIANRELRAHI